MSTNPPPARTRPPPRRVEVARVAPLTERMLRITFVGSELEDFDLQVATHVKLFLPALGEEEPRLPSFTPEGIVWQEGARPSVRTYTPRAFRPESGELDVDFFLHGEGPASTWARTAGPGAKAGIAGPGRSHYVVDREASDFVIAGDESAIPAIATILEALPAGARASVFVEVSDSLDEQELPSPAQTQIRWLHRGGETGTEGALLMAALRDFDLPRGARCWVATESVAVRDIRRLLLSEKGVEPARLVTRGYWKRAVANHPDHDFGTDD